ncbi:MAG: metallophosphoesterase family protein [Methylococcaceae bacterium]
MFITFPSRAIALLSMLISAAPLSAASSFTGNLILGAPSAESIKANVYSPDQSGQVYIEYGTSPGVYSQRTATYPLVAGQARELTLNGLQGATAYVYRLQFKSSTDTAFSAGEARSVHTARASGDRFTFAVQGDSHPERLNKQFDPELYALTLNTAAQDRPDFYFAMGDDFSIDTLNPDTVNAQKVEERYQLQRPYFSLIGQSAPLFLVNGNHEQASMANLNGTPDSIAVWAQNARNSLYSLPVPDDFYTGDSDPVEHIGLLRDYYAFTWGDALFVVIDPYWHTPQTVDNVFGAKQNEANSGKGGRDLWDITLGESQYRWFKNTLETSKAKYKFVFTHHILGTGRGGVELADSYEWGGRDKNGNWAFDVQRPGWSAPIHQLMADNRVTVFFQGHDHVWVHQQLDGVTYQTVSEPADPNYALYFDEAYTSGDKFPNTGYTRVQVSPVEVQVDYVRTYLPSLNGLTPQSGQVAFSYTIKPPEPAPVKEDRKAPVVTAFSIPWQVNTRQIPIARFTADDDVAVTGYALTTGTTPPSLKSSAWREVPPTVFPVDSGGIKTLYAWARDAAGHVSRPEAAAVMIDLTAPVINTYTLAAECHGTQIPVNTFKATDNREVTGYLITENATSPDLNAPDWSSTPPTVYTATQAGTQKLYAWVKDAAGNLSKAKTAATPCKNL